MAYKKISFTEPNKLYGDRGIVGVGRGGLAVHKIGRSSWTISHVASGAVIRSGSSWGTKEAALDHMDMLLLLPVDWPKPWDGVRPSFENCRDAIRSIIMDGITI